MIFMISNIPNRIIHIWGGGEHGLSLLSKAAVANVKLLHPDFDYLFFDDKQIDKIINNEFPEYRSVFNSFFYPIQRYDFFRYLAVYHFGGFYLDLDVFLAYSLSSLLKFDCVFPFEELTINGFLRQEYGMDWEIGNYAFGAAAGHPFVHAIIKNCVRAQNDPEWVHKMMKPIPRMCRDDFYVFNTTGPGLVSRTLAEYPEASKQVKVLFPENVCDSTSWHCFGTFGVHLMAGTWLNRKGILRRIVTRKWMAWTRRRFLKESLILGKSRSIELKRRS
jgi:inositol phosphorylceramide mannosyltransferase catalytic subunit